MNFDGKTILLIGASGGIGQEIARQLASKGAHLVLCGRRRQELQKLAEDIRHSHGMADILEGDIANHPKAIASNAVALVGQLDMVVNCAGMQTFGFSQFEESEDTAKVFAANVVGPIQLINALLPDMLRRGAGRIVNVGSIFGSIGFPCFSSYSASKFALRGYSEALRRELHGSGIKVHYIAPRYTKTGFNSSHVSQMADALHMKQDHPADVAMQVISAIERSVSTRYLGWPEKLFVRLNALLPGLVDISLCKQVKQMSLFARMQVKR